jgi:hypothetical protein
VLVVLALASACHTITRDRLIRPGAPERVVDRERATAGALALVVTERGRWRIIEPLDCPSAERTPRTTAVEVTTKPNYATFVVGVIGLSLGAIATVSAASRGDTDSPFLYGGIALAGVGLPFTIGPLVGNGAVVLQEGGLAFDTRVGPNVRCGERAARARSAQLKIAGLDIASPIDGDGVLTVAPYDVIDAFAPIPAIAWDVSGRVDDRALTGVLDRRALTSGAAAYLAASGLEVRVEPLRQVPSLTTGPLRATLLAAPESRTAARVAITITNQGPGSVWALRGQLSAPSAPALDGRMLYGGALAKGQTRELTIHIPLSDAAAAALADKPLALSIELRDAHATVPATPIRLRGPLTRAP